MVHVHLFLKLMFICWMWRGTCFQPSCNVQQRKVTQALEGSTAATLKLQGFTLSSGRLDLGVDSSVGTCAMAAVCGCWFQVAVLHLRFNFPPWEAWRWMRTFLFDTEAIRWPNGQTVGRSSKSDMKRHQATQRSNRLVSFLQIVAITKFWSSLEKASRTQLLCEAERTTVGGGP